MTRLLACALLLASCGTDETELDTGGDTGADTSTDTSTDTGTDTTADTTRDGTINSDCNYFPPTDPGDDTWANVDPESLGWDTEALEDTVAYVGEQNSTAFVVLYCGRIVVERYWQGWDLHSTAVIASAAKSITAVLVGIAIEDDLIDLDASVTDYLGEGWSAATVAQESAITVRHLLTMTSGLNDDLEFVTEPGSQWYYNTPAYQVLGMVIEETTGATRREFGDARLEVPVGMNDSVWRPNSVNASARDMARFGLLILAGGQWNDTAILPSTSVQQMLEPQVLNEAYGYLWWLNDGETWILPGDGTDRGDGRLIPNAPNDLVAALGVGDKKIYVVPSEQLVVVRHGDATGIPQLALSSFDNVLWQRLNAAIP